ncbi:L,D-transpeptidase family protein [Paenibacillus glycinis]|uniref:L,D-transpeptidase family protein n=1 Tax=Paenibacillus glycinis TaxID=2697035 RepID=A0ABW9XYE8_9BACL|nr:L,D-transpeptidase family protein [Paenibacillus glycinis]NBD27438.1 L,D-transpeptidase family protein [Paenibacillus glycinis]
MKIIVLALVIALPWVMFSPAPTHAQASKNELIIVNKQTNELAFFADGELIKTFSVATGRTSDLTPEGSFKIVNKIKNRPYYKEHIPGGDPKNPLGDRWLGLEVNGTEGTTYAIHGNNNSRSIGKYVSAGCIRMKNDEIHWLFPQIELGTTVIITTSSLAFADIAEQHAYPVLKTYEGKLLLNGESMKLDRELIVAGSSVFIPMRDVFEMLGAEVKWDQAAQTVTAVIGDRTIKHRPLTDTVEVNGVSVDIAASKIVDNTVLLPLRNISELIGYRVEWNGKAREIRITA